MGSTPESASAPDAATPLRPDADESVSRAAPLSSTQLRSGSITALLVLAGLYTLYTARFFFLPIIAAILLAFIFAPVVRGLARLGIPQPLAAGVLCTAVVVLVGGAMLALSAPAAEMLEKAPSTVAKLERRMRAIKGSLRRVNWATEKVAEIATTDKRLRVETESLAERVFDDARQVVSMSVMTVILLFFVLASGKTMLQKLVGVMPSLTDKKRVVGIAHELGREVSRYLATITFINVGLGLAVTLAMHTLGMPTPALWGALATLLNFVPYLGALIGTVVITVIGLVNFETWGASMAPPLVYLGLTSLEGFFLTPAILGRRLPLEPMAIVVGLLFWGWLWGVPGAFMAVPIMTAVKILCDHFDGSRWIGTLLGRVERSSATAAKA